MSQIYFPSCNFTAASPEAARRIRAYLEKRMPVAGCCRTDRKVYEDGSTGIYFCQACRETLEAREHPLATENLFVYLDRDVKLSLPQYQGLTVHVQDCWRDREHPEIFQAVRNLLGKMGVTIVEMEENREKSVFCGNLHFESHKDENLQLLSQYPDMPIYQLPPQVQEALMREQVEKYNCSLVVCYCNRCVKGVITGGGRGVHLLELITGTFEM